MNTLSRRVVVSDWDYLLKFSMFINSNAAFHTSESITYHRNSLVSAKNTHTKMSIVTLPMGHKKHLDYKRHMLVI